MKDISKKLLSSFLAVCLTIAPLKPTQATGIPVVDVAHIVQTIAGYVQSLTEYSELLSQGVIEAAELAQMIDEYRQMLLEYQSYLNQIRQLRDVIDTATWVDILNAVATIDYGNTDIALIPELDPEDEDFSKDLMTIVRKNNTVPYTTDHLVDSMADLGAAQKMRNKIGRTNERLTRKYKVYENQLASVALNNKASIMRREAILEADNEVENLGEESDLATLQLLAKQQLLQARQNEAIVKVLNDLLMNYESPSLAQTRSELEAIDLKIAIIKARQRTNLYSNTFTEDCNDTDTDVDNDCDLSGIEIE